MRFKKMSLLTIIRADCDVLRRYMPNEAVTRSYMLIPLTRIKDEDEHSEYQ